MRTLSFTLLCCSAVLGCGPVAGAQTAPAPAGGGPWDSVAAILGTPAVRASGYVRFNLPRRDLTVRVAGVTLAVPMAQGSWAGFDGTAAKAEAMGDLVLTVPELKPVLAALARQRIEVTGVHNHLAGEEPRLVYVHFHAMGAASDLASRLDSALARTGTPRPVAPVQAPPVTIDTALVFHSLGARGSAAGSVAQVSFDLVRRRVRWEGRTLVPAMAYATPVNIQMVNRERAVATGDFALLAAQVPRVLGALAASGVTAMALHTHMVGESPTVYFVHFWADGPLADVVHGLKAALDAAQ